MQTFRAHCCKDLGNADFQTLFIPDRHYSDCEF